MPSYLKISTLLAIAVCSLGPFGVASCAEGKPAQWGVLFSGLPQKVSVSAANHNAILYILKQTHETLFRRDDGQNYTTRVLKKWSRSYDNKSFSFCPDTKQMFDESHSLDRGFFLKYISDTAARYMGKVVVSQEGDCVAVNFQEPQKGFLEYLTFYENSPSLPRLEYIEDGLGPYRIESIEKDTISLLRKRPVTGGINKIVLYDYKGGQDERLSSRGISDFNRIPPFDVPEWVRKDFKSFNNIQLRSIALAINHPDVKIRRLVYNCLDAAELRKAYFPKTENVYDIANILPLGMVGAKAGRPAQSCGNLKASGISLILANWRDDNQEGLAKLANEFEKKTGVSIKVKNYLPAELVKIIHDRPRPYNLLVMAIDAVRPNYEAFLSPFFREKAYIDSKPRKAAALYAKMNSEFGEEARAPLAMEIADELGREGIALPLYQVGGVFYYPKGIRNLEAGRGFLEYPEVADFRW